MYNLFQTQEMQRVTSIPYQIITEKGRCYFIAEIGQNHQGCINTAKKLIHSAKHAGADCVKFQKTSLEHKFSKYALEKEYNSDHSWGRTYGEHKEFLEFSENELRSLNEYAKSIGIAFTASPKDIPSLDFLIDMDVPFIKIGSGDTEDFLLLKRAAECKKPLIVSTGMLDMVTVHNVYDFLKKYHTNFIFLHCVSSYPTHPNDANLKVIKTLQEAFPDIGIGYSGHEEGYIVSLAAAAIGAKVIERHITLDQHQKGSDHICSLTPEQFKLMVENIRIIEQSMGSKQKQFLPCEKNCYEKLGKCLVASKDLLNGSILNQDCINIKVGYPKGIAAKHFHRVMGKVLKRSILVDQSIQEGDLE